MPYTRLYNYPTPYDRARTGTPIMTGEVSLPLLCAVKFSRFRYKDALNTFINMSAAQCSRGIYTEAGSRTNSFAMPGRTAYMPVKTNIIESQEKNKFICYAEAMPRRYSIYFKNCLVGTGNRL